MAEKPYTLDKAGRFKVRWTQNGKRCSLHLGSKPDLRESDAHTIAKHVRELIRTTKHGLPPTDAVTGWLKTVDRRLLDALKRHDILPPGLEALSPAARTLGELLDIFFEAKEPDLKGRSVLQLTRVREHLEKFWGRDTKLADITPVEAGRFRTHLTKPEATTWGREPLAVATQRRRLAYAKEFFNFAVNNDILAKSPFRGIKPLKGKTENRKVFVPRETIDKILPHCPNADWRTLIVLGRYLGVRTPSEPRELRWKHVDFAKQLVRVTSPKTAHHAGHESRLVPLFPEVREALEGHRASLPAPPHPDDKIIDPETIPQIEYPSSAPLQRQFKKILAVAGIEPWPVLFHSLRYSRQEELTATDWGLKQVCDWIGNTPEVALASYLQTTAEDFAAAANGQPPPRKNPGQSGGAALTRKDIIETVGETLQFHGVSNLPGSKATGFLEDQPGYTPTSENPNVLGDSDGTKPGTPTPAPVGTTLEKHGQNTNVLGYGGVMRRSGQTPKILGETAFLPPVVPSMVPGKWVELTDCPSASEPVDTELRQLVAVWPRLPLGTRAELLSHALAAVGDRQSFTGWNLAHVTAKGTPCKP